MEWVSKIKKRLSDVKRQKFFRKKQLPWQMEGLDRELKNYVNISDADSFLVLMENMNINKYDHLLRLNKYLRSKGKELMVVCYLKPDEEKIKSESLSNFFFISDESLNEIGEVKASFIDRLKSKKWDICVLDFKRGVIGLEYLVYLMHVQCIVSEKSTSLLELTDVQVVLDSSKNENIYTYILENQK